MANQNDTSANESRSNPTPFIIIGLIFLATLLGIWWIMQSGNGPGAASKNTTNTNASPTQQSTNIYSNAPAGASPERFKGSANATVVLEEFADFQCGACATKHPVFNEINSIYGSKIKFVFRNYPLIRQHPKAYDAAVAAEAAGFQDKFWEMQNLLFANQVKWINDPNHRTTFEGYAKTLNLDTDRFSTDSLGLNAKNRVDSDMRRGNALSLNSTPSLFVNGKPIAFEQMTVEGIKALVDAEIERMSPKKEDTQSTESNSNSEDTGAEKKNDEKKTDTASSDKKDATK